MAVKEPDDDRSVTVTPPAPPPPAAAPAAATPPAEAPKPPDPDVIYRERLKADHGVEDPEEIRRWRERAQHADILEQQLQARASQPMPPSGMAPQRPAIDLAQWQAYARIDPGGAYLQMQQIEAQRRQYEGAQQMAFMESRIRAAQEFTAAETLAERYVREEFPEAYNQQSKLHKEGQRVYSSMPWLATMGNGFEIATKIAAANLGIVLKSKRTPSVTPDEVADQAPERGAKKPATPDADDTKPLTPRQKKMARDMGVSEKDYRTFQKARASGKNVKVG